MHTCTPRYNKFESIRGICLSFHSSQIILFYLHFLSTQSETSNSNSSKPNNSHIYIFYYIYTCVSEPFVLNLIIVMNLLESNMLFFLKNLSSKAFLIIHRHDNAFFYVYTDFLLYITYILLLHPIICNFSVKQFFLQIQMHI